MAMKSDAEVAGVGPSCGTSSFSFPAPKFSGDGSFVRFKSDLDTFYTIHNFNDDLKLRFLPLCLTGVARDAFESLTSEHRRSYDAAVESLTKFFVRPCALDAHAKLRELKFEASMSLDAFIIQFKHLMGQAFPGHVSDQVLFHSLLPTLPIKYQEQIIAQGLETFDDAVSKVRNLIRSERFQTPVRQVRREESTAMEQILQRIESIERRLSHGQGGPRGGNLGSHTRRPDTSSAPRRACYCCGSLSHLRATCPLRDTCCSRCGRRSHTSDVCPLRGNGHGGVVPQSAEQRPPSQHQQ